MLYYNLYQIRICKLKKINKKIVIKKNFLE